MKEFIENTVKEIRAKGDSIASDLSGKINGLKWTVKPPAQEDKESAADADRSKNLYIAGGVLAAASGVSLITSFGLRPISYIGLLGGIGLIAYGYMKSKGGQTTNAAKNEPKIDIEEVKNFFSDRIFSYLETANKDWETFIEDTKAKVQAQINSSALDDTKKSAAMFHTYVTETLSLTTTDLLNSFVGCNALDEAMRLKSSFADTVTAKIRETVKAQTDKYNSITA
jgi:hypothetical protein